MRKTPLVLVAALAASLAACSDDDVVTKFAAALSNRDASGAAKLTSDPSAADAALAASFAGMGDGKPTVSAGKDGDRRTLNWSWRLPRDKQARYSTTVAAGGGKITWHPSVLHDDATDGTRLLYSDDKTYSTPVLDRRNSPLLTWQPVRIVSLAANSSASADALARRLSVVDPSMTAASIRTSLKAGTGDADVISLREADAERVGDLRSIDGVRTRVEGRLLTASKTLRSPVTAGLDERWRRDVDAAAGGSVSIVDGQNKPIRLVDSFPGGTAKPVRTTIDSALQTAANNAVAGEKRPAMLVAIAPSTGGILAVAQNTAADKQGPLALTGSSHFRVR